MTSKVPLRRAQHELVERASSARYLQGSTAIGPLPPAARLSRDDVALEPPRREQCSPGARPRQSAHRRARAVSTVVVRRRPASARGSGAHRITTAPIPATRRASARARTAGQRRTSSAERGAAQGIVARQPAPVWSRCSCAAIPRTPTRSDSEHERGRGCACSSRNPAILSHANARVRRSARASRRLVVERRGRNGSAISQAFGAVCAAARTASGG